MKYLAQIVGCMFQLWTCYTDTFTRKLHAATPPHSPIPLPLRGSVARLLPLRLHVTTLISIILLLLKVIPLVALPCGAVAKKDYNCIYRVFD